MTRHSNLLRIQSASTSAALAICAEARAKLAALEFPFGSPFQHFDICELVAPEQDMTLVGEPEEPEAWELVWDARQQANDAERKR
jgi:hypothetical protein